MGFLELDKVNTLELFLTDRGKELMLKQNGQGLYDLINQFSTDDRDYDYRRSSDIWVEGISPQPDGSGLPWGTTGIPGAGNSQGITGGVNPCATGPVTNQCWFDMPDVRGDRGQKIISCNMITATTEGIAACTNIYCFYDVTSTRIADARAAKLGLTDWFNSITASTPNYTGKIFHIPVYGETWINTSYYPWNGKLDAWDWAPGRNTAGTSWTPAFCGDPTLPNYARCTTYWAQGGVNTVGPSPTTSFDGETTRKYPTPITGLFLQANNWGVNTGNYSGFPVLPPGAGSQTGSRAEFWTTGCTLNTLGGKPDAGPIPNGEFAVSSFKMIINNPIVSFTATSIGGGYSSVNFDPTALEPPYPTIFGGLIYPGLSGYTLEEYFDVFDSVLVTSAASQYSEYASPENLCVDNCCPDPLTYTGPGLFGCQDCSPFDSTITTAAQYRVFASGWNPTTELAPGISAGTAHIQVHEWGIPCEKYRGMDRNVLVVNIFDEVDAQPRQSHAGNLMLGAKNFYNLTDSSNWQNSYPGNYMSDPFPYIGQLNGTQTGSAGEWLDKNFLGYHGHNRADTSAGSAPCWDYKPCCAPTGVPSDWNQWNINATCGTGIIEANKQIQPTISYVYGEDLFHKTNAFYNNFRGFVYPVLATESSAFWGGIFALHLYGAMKGRVISQSEFVDNPTCLSQGMTLSAITNSNPYSVITPVIYTVNTTQWYEPASTTEPYDSGQLGPGYNSWYGFYGHTNGGNGQSGTPVRGLQNFGWGFSPDVGCAVPDCNTSLIFSGGTFEKDLNAFLSGSSYLIETVTTGCTECQCLPSVFLNHPGPILVDPVDPVGCPCPDGSTSPECCPPPTPTPETLCGPSPLSTTNLQTSQTTVNSTGEMQRRSARQATYTIPSPQTSLMTGNHSLTKGLEVLDAPKRVNSLDKRYRRDCSIGFEPHLHQYLDNEGMVQYTIELRSTSRYNGKLIESNALFYWKWSSGFKFNKGTLKETQPCIKVTKSQILKLGTKAGPVFYFNPLEENQDIFTQDMKASILTQELCMSMGYILHGSLLTKTKRIRVWGNTGFGWGMKVL